VAISQGAADITFTNMEFNICRAALRLPWALAEYTIKLVYFLR
jgi:hypothetical protein